MMILLRWVINALALLAAARLISGFEINSFYIALIAALVLGLLNAVVRPIILLLTLPVNILTLGLFTFVVNALMVLLMSTFIKGVVVDGFLPALFVAIFLWVVGTLTSFFLRAAHE